MTRQALLTGLIAAALISAGSGCCQNQCRPGATSPGAPGLLGYGGVGQACATCGGGGCAECAAQTPGQHIRQLMTCGAGCGEVYRGEWISDPPACAEPCDGCGNWVGYRGSKKRWSQAWRSIWGYRYSDPGYHQQWGDIPAGATIIDEQIPAGAVIYSSQVTNPAPAAIPQRSALRRTTVGETSHQPYYTPQGSTQGPTRGSTTRMN